MRGLWSFPLKDPWRKTNEMYVCNAEKHKSSSSYGRKKYGDSSVNIFVLAVHDSWGIIHANFETPLWEYNYFILFQEVKHVLFALKYRKSVVYIFKWSCFRLRRNVCVCLCEQEIKNSSQSLTNLFCWNWRMYAGRWVSHYDFCPYFLKWYDAEKSSCWCFCAHILWCLYDKKS